MCKSMYMRFEKRANYRDILQKKLTIWKVKYQCKRNSQDSAKLFFFLFYKAAVVTIYTFDNLLYWPDPNNVAWLSQIRYYIIGKTAVNIVSWTYSNAIEIETALSMISTVSQFKVKYRFLEQSLRSE